MGKLTRSSWAGLLSLGIVSSVAATGFAWHECILLVGAAVVAHRLFLWRMDVDAPMDAWRAGVRCVVAGLTGMLAALALSASVLAGVSGVWQVSHEHGWAALDVMAAVGLLVSAVQLDNRRRLTEALFWAVLIAATAISLEGTAAGYPLLPCAVVTALIAYLGLSAWRLARESGGELMRCGQR